MDTSNCCGAPRWGETDICSKCWEHADFEDDEESEELELYLEEIQDELTMALQADLEHGSSWVNEQAWDEFKRKYPYLNEVIESILSAGGDK